MKKMLIAFIISAALLSSCASTEDAQVSQGASLQTSQTETETETESKESEPEEKPEPEAPPPVVQDTQEAPAPLTAQVIPEPQPAPAPAPVLVPVPEPESTPAPVFVPVPAPQPPLVVYTEPEAPRWTQSDRESLATRVAVIHTELSKFSNATLSEVQSVFEQLSGVSFSSFMNQVQSFEADPDNAGIELLEAVDKGRSDLTRTFNTIVERRAQDSEKNPPLLWDDSDKDSFAKAAQVILDHIKSLSMQDYNRLAYLFYDDTNDRIIRVMNEVEAFVDNPRAADTGTTTGIIDRLDSLAKALKKLSN